MLVPIAQRSDANAEKRRKIQLRRRIGRAVGSAGMHVGVKFSEQRCDFKIIEDNHVVDSLKRGNEHGTSPLGENGTPSALKFSRACVGMNSYHEDFAFGARRCSFSTSDRPERDRILSRVSIKSEVPRKKVSQRNSNRKRREKRLCLLFKERADFRQENGPRQIGD